MSKKTLGVAATPDGSTEVALVCDGWTPIVTFRHKSEGGFAKRVENNVSWMLQELLGSGSKVSTLYESCEPDSDTEQAAKALDVNVSDMNIVQISGRTQRWQNVKAVGIFNANGKRSHKFALVIALGMTGGYSDKFMKELEKRGLDKGLATLLQQLEKLQAAGSVSWKNSNSSWCVTDQERAQAEPLAARRESERQRPNCQDRRPKDRTERRESRSRSVKRSRSALAKQAAVGEHSDNEQHSQESVLDINHLMTKLHAKCRRQIVVPYFGRYRLEGRNGLWQVIGRGHEHDTWRVAPYDYDDPHRIDTRVILTQRANDLRFPRNTLLTHINWNLSAFVDGRFRRENVQSLYIDETCSCEVTVGEDPSNARVIIYISSTLNEGSAIHYQPKKGIDGLGAASLLRACTVVTMYWKGTTNKAPWTIQAPRRIIALMSEIVEMHKATSLRGLLMGCDKPDIWGFSRGAMTVISILRQFSPFAGPCFRCAILVAPYFLKEWRNTCIYPYIFDELGDCPVRIVLGERDSWFRESNAVIETFVRYHRSKSHLYHQGLPTALGKRVHSFKEKHDHLSAQCKGLKPRRSSYQDMVQFEAAQQEYTREKQRIAHELETDASGIHCQLDMSAWWRGNLTIIYVKDSDHDQAWQRLMADMSFAQMLLLERGSLERVILQSQRQLHGSAATQACLLREHEREVLMYMADLGKKVTEVDGTRGASSGRSAQRQVFQMFSERADADVLEVFPRNLTNLVRDHLEQRKDIHEDDSRLCEDYFTYNGNVCFAFRGHFELKATGHQSAEVGMALRDINRSQASYSMVP